MLAVLWHPVERQWVQSGLLDGVLMAPLVCVAELQRRNVLPVPETARRSAPAPLQTAPIPGAEGIAAREPHAVGPLTAERNSPSTPPMTRSRRRGEASATEEARRGSDKGLLALALIAFRCALIRPRSTDVRISPRRRAARSSAHFTAQARKAVVVASSSPYAAKAASSVHSAPVRFAWRSSRSKQPRA